MINIKIDRRREYVDIEGSKKVVLAEAFAAIVGILKAFNADDIKIILNSIKEVADEQIPDL